MRNDRIRLLNTPAEWNESSDMDSCKSSYDADEPHFRYGFFLYSLVTSAEQPQQVDLWSKIQVSLSGPCTRSEASQPSRECRFRSKAVAIEFASSNFAIRNPENQFVEWGRVSVKHFSYSMRAIKVVFDRAYTPPQAFEMWIKWFMATGQTVADVVQKQWARHAQRLNFLLFPVPEDAFAEPTNRMSSPLRCPIFVPFKSDCVPGQEVSPLCTRALVVA